MLKFSCNTFCCTLHDAALLPEYKGSTFRGAFGGALKKVVCALKQKECSSCLLASRCLYARIFEPGIWHTDNSRFAAPPHPYIIEPDLSIRTAYKAGETFSFNLILFGEFTDSLPYFIYAVESMGESGIGKRTGESRARFSIRDVTAHDGVVIYDSESRKISHSQAGLMQAPVMSAHGLGRIELNFKTPLRVKNDNRFSDELDFQTFIRGALRRVSAMHAAFGDGDPPLDYRALIAEAASVKTESSSLKWRDWRRYSNRQHDEMLFGGMVGSISFTGNIAPFLQIIEQAKVMHIGKQTTFGLGAFEYFWVLGVEQKGGADV